MEGEKKMFQPRQRVLIKRLPPDVLPTADTGMIIRAGGILCLSSRTVTRLWQVKLDGVAVEVPIAELDLAPFDA